MPRLTHERSVRSDTPMMRATWAAVRKEGPALRRLSERPIAWPAFLKHDMCNSTSLDQEQERPTVVTCVNTSDAGSKRSGELRWSQIDRNRPTCELAANRCRQHNQSGSVPD